ncbi:MAG: glycosyltransferase [Patescibacteria group bacterium]
MNHEPPLLSIILPVRNQCRELTLFLFELHRHFENRNETFEIMVIDDGSNDQTSFVVEKLSHEFPSIMLLTHTEPLGLGIAAREGFEKARGNFSILTRPSLGFSGLEELLGQLTYSREDILLGKVRLQSSLWPPHLFLFILWKLSDWFLSIFVYGGVSARLSPIIFSRETGKETGKRGRVRHGGYEFELLYLAQRFKKKITLRSLSQPFMIFTFPIFYFLTVVKELIRSFFRFIRH